MKKILLILLLSITSFNVLAKDKFICSTFVLIKYKSIVPEDEYDKVKHCSFACILSKKCGVVESFAVGVAKEIADLLGYGNPELEHLAANRVGIRFGTKVRNVYQCLPLCKKVY